MRHGLSTILSLAVVGVPAGRRSLTAVREHATDLEAAQPAAPGLAPGAVPPSESTIGRVLAGLDAAGLDARICSWPAIRTGTVQGRRLIAVDGRTVRGARSGDQAAPHLLAALDHATGTVLTQRKVVDRSNEIPALPELVEPLAWTGPWSPPTPCAPRPPPRPGPTSPQSPRSSRSGAPAPPPGAPEPARPVRSAPARSST
ncbi:transposase family protein [Actinomyces israelii]|uniref:transposase family protein n=1 Tax=Actinomyces israelii TaxID=1659 RepID=UPI002553BF29|nr:transposase family protein [Actinomyces israelii]